MAMQTETVYQEECRLPLMHYGKARSMRWFGKRNESRVDEHSIDDELIEWLEVRLARYEARNAFLRFWQRLFTPIEKKRNLLCYWAAKQLVNNNRIQDAVNPLNQKAITILNQYAHKTTSSILKSIFSRFIPLIGEIIHMGSQAKVKDSSVKETVVNSPAKMLTEEFNVFKNKLWAIVTDPGFTLKQREEQVQEELSNMQKYYEYLRKKATNSEKKELQINYRRHQQLLTRLLDLYRSRLQNPNEHLERIRLPIFVLGNYIHNANVLRNHEMSLNQFFQEIAELIGSIRPSAQYEAFKVAVREHIDSSWNKLFNAYQIYKTEHPEDEAAVTALLEKLKESFKTKSEALLVDLPNSIATPSTSYALIKRLQTSDKTEQSVASPSIPTIASGNHPPSQTLQAQFALDLSQLKTKGEALLVQARALPLSQQAPAEKESACYSHLQAFKQFFKEKLKIYHSDHWYSIEVADINANVCTRTLIETYQHYNKCFIAILNGDASLASKSTSLFDEVVRGQSEIREMLAEMDKKLDRLQKNTDELKVKVAELVHSTEELKYMVQHRQEELDINRERLDRNEEQLDRNEERLNRGEEQLDRNEEQLKGMISTLMEVCKDNPEQYRALLKLSQQVTQGLSLNQSVEEQSPCVSSSSSLPIDIIDLEKNIGSECRVAQNPYFLVSP